MSNVRYVGRPGLRAARVLTYEEREALRRSIDRKRRESLSALKLDHSGRLEPMLILEEPRRTVEDYWMRPYPREPVPQHKASTGFYPLGFKYDARFESRHYSFLFNLPNFA